MSDKFQFRTVTVKGQVYLHRDDVARYVAELGATEETDVRNRLNAAAALLSGRMSYPPGYAAAAVSLAIRTVRAFPGVGCTPNLPLDNHPDLAVLKANGATHYSIDHPTDNGLATLWLYPNETATYRESTDAHGVNLWEHRLSTPLDTNINRNA